MAANADLRAEQQMRRGFSIPGRRVMAWLCSYVLVLQLVLAGLASGVMAAPADGGMLLCAPSAMQSDAPAPKSHDSRILYCALCPSLGHGPALLPQVPAAVPPSTSVARVFNAGVSPRAPPRLPVLGEQARPRAPPRMA